MGLGIKLFNRLKLILMTFTGLQMWTFTIDPKLFRSHEEAYWYVKKGRCLNDLIAKLHKAGHLHSKRYFCVVEWHKNGGAHFHVLLDARFVPFQLVCDLWNANRPKWAGPVEGKRPGFGSIRFSAEKHVFFEPEHAAHYACKYLIGQPKNGFPTWVLDSTKRIRMFSTSQGFWGDTTPKLEKESTKAKPKVPQSHLEDCFCAECRGDEEPGSDDKPPASTIRERLKRCRKEAVVLRVTSYIKPDGQVIEEREFVRKVEVPYATVLAALGKTIKECPFLEITPSDLEAIETAYIMSGQEAKAA
ncbi:MAG: hypothetical protein WD045_02400 [Pirellulaceae bacterium]